MDLQTRKIAFIQEFLSIESEELLSRFEKLLKNRKTAKEDLDFRPMTMEEFENGIEQSIEDSKNERVIEANQLLEEIKKWG